MKITYIFIPTIKVYDNRVFHLDKVVEDRQLNMKHKPLCF